MRWWLTTLTLTTAIVASGIQASAQPLTIWWLSFVVNGNAQVPIRINPTTGLVDLVNGVFIDSRYPSLSADGRQVVFQVGSGLNAQVWQAVWDAANGRWQVNPVPIPQTDPPQPLIGIHPVTSADGNHIAFASVQDYGFGNNNRWQIYVLDRLQNRIVPISFLWQDTDGDGMRDTFAPSLGNCIPVSISANGRIVVFLAQSPNALNIVDADGDGTSDPVNNPPSDWLILIHDRDADGNGIYDEAGIGATSTSIGNPLDSNGNYIPAASVSVSANGRIIAFATPNPTNPDQWHIFVRDWQSGTGDFVRDGNNNPVLAFAPALSDDGTHLAYLTPQLDNDNDRRVDEDPTDGVDNDNDGKTDEDPPELPYFQAKADLVVQQIIDPSTGDLTPSGPWIRLSVLQPPSSAGTADGSAGWGYSDWWGAVTLVTHPTNPNVAYVAFHAWATNLIELQNDLLRDNDGDGRVDEDPIGDGDKNGNPDDDGDGQIDEDPPVNFYQGVPNIFLAQFDFGNDSVQLWQLLPPSASPTPAWSPRALPVSLERNGTVFRLPLAPSLLPVVSFVNGNRLAIAFQSLVVFDANDTNGLWDIYLADVLLP
ncbi:TolB family protein [Fervidibacter sacchari]